ncbi:MAG: hypothetical protein ACJZ9F_05950 [Rhodospirillaceae bacterium]
MPQLLKLFLTALIFISSSGIVQAQKPTELIAIRDIIWAKEKEIYKARAKTGLDYYIANSSSSYIGWPPGLTTPSPLSQLEKNQALITKPNAERLELFFNDIAIHGDTAVIYYNTHRTMLPNGEIVDQRFHIAHVWTKDSDEDWKLLGAMGRLESE